MNNTRTFPFSILVKWVIVPNRIWREKPALRNWQ